MPFLERCLDFERFSSICSGVYHCTSDVGRASFLHARDEKIVGVGDTRFGKGWGCKGQAGGVGRLIGQQVV